MGECSFKRASRHIVALTRGFQKPQERREEEHPIQLLMREYLRHANTDVRLCSQTGLKGSFIHLGQAFIGKHNRCMHESMNLAILRPNLFVRMCKRVTIRCVSTDVTGNRSQG